MARVYIRILPNAAKVTAYRYTSGNARSRSSLHVIEEILILTKAVLKL